MKKNIKVIPKKHLGQNFLIDERIKEKIVSSCNLTPEDIILEIGPGQGALTRLLAKEARRVIAVEMDHVLANQLKEDFQGSNVSIIHFDILKYSFESLPQKIKVIGNLPYNISTPIITKILNNSEKFSVGYFTLQKEYGERMAANVNTKTYGALSCFVQYFADIKLLFKIMNTAFRPVPKVQSCFLELKIKERRDLEEKKEKFLFKLIEQAFKHRRKTIYNSLSSIIPKETIPQLLEPLELNIKARAENLSLRDYINIANAIKKNGVKRSCHIDLRVLEVK